MKHMAVLGTLLVVVACGGAVESGNTGTADVERVPCAASGVVAACSVNDAEGTRACLDGVWSQCGGKGSCSPGETKLCPTQPTPGAGLRKSCVVQNGYWSWNEQECFTPLVLAFEDQPVQFTRAGGWFDLVGSARTNALQTDWVSAETPWLVLDRNGNGRIDDGSELFGSMTRLRNGARAQNGFQALAELDTNRDGFIDAHDHEFSRLLLWRDVNQDRESSPLELQPLAHAGALRLELAYHEDRHCVEHACEVERAGFTFVLGGHHRRGAVIDVHFAPYE
jgi:hypothetical protein